ncbi:MAG: hypothetical protein AMXMBFR84_30050 [Candidatus Hydrogenedentota bacterium]
MPSNYTVRRMSRNELDEALVLAREEGWNPGLHDAEAFYAADPNGFFRGELDGQFVGCISAVAYNDDYGFMGFYIVRKEFRGQGHGLPLWNAAIECMGSRTIGADGVPSMLAKYETMGFRIAYRNVRYKGEGGGEEPEGLIGLDAVSMADLLAFDREHVPAPRESFLKSWIHQPGSVVRVLLDQGRITGYGMLRPCLNACKVGPLFANDPAVAGRILNGLRAHARGDLYLDVPEPNAAAVALAKSLDMQPVFETSRIYKGAPPALPLDRIYGVTSFELG